MSLRRRLGPALLSIAAVAIWFLLAPSENSSNNADFSSDIALALANYETNNSNTQGAPQQQVVNGWVTKDLLAVLARQQNVALSPKGAPRDNRIPAELLLVVLALALIIRTTNEPAARQTIPPAASDPTHEDPAPF